MPALRLKPVGDAYPLTWVCRRERGTARLLNVAIESEEVTVTDHVTRRVVVLFFVDANAKKWPNAS